MRRPLSYDDAAKFLGAKEHRLVKALDRIAGTALLAGSMGSSELLGIFDAKVEFVQRGHELLTKLAEKRSGVSRYNRTQRLLLANEVIVLVAFCEAFDELELPLRFEDLDITHPRATLNLDSPVPVPRLSYEDNLAVLREHYRALSTVLGHVIAGLAVWDGLNETQQARVVERLRDLPGLAVRRYEELFRQLATDHPEVALWASVRDGQATRGALRAVEESLSRVASGAAPDERRMDLSKRNRAVLGRPIVAPDDVPEGLTIPLLRDAYMDPLFRVAEVRTGEAINAEQWWEDHAVRDDLDTFLSGYLTSRTATVTPLLVLGQPGAGKSLLTKVLAARLPVKDFLCVRVELRTAPADADLLAQVEHGIRVALQEQVSLAALARSAGEALPVILLDGFDEMLLATGVSQSDYLTKLAEFQQARADLDQPVVVVVTSRTSVADRAAVPSGTVALRLEPFNEDQVERWVGVWNSANAKYFARRGLAELDLRWVLGEHPELAAQPLLLLMLALYDVEDNALLHHRVELSRAGLYEGLLRQFARREVRKGGGWSEEDVDKELRRLSVVAFAMFNRGAHWVSEADLDADLAALPTRSEGWRGETVVGRFFFLHRPQAVRGKRTLRSYEFLHATFGEFLVAWRTWELIRSMDEVEFHSLLSFVPITGRQPVIDFLEELVRDHPHGERKALADRLITLFRAERKYLPQRLSPTTRLAAYQANLVTVGALVGDSLPLAELFPDSEETDAEWRRLALLWKSQLSTEDWEALRTGLVLLNTGVAIRHRAPTDVGLPELNDFFRDAEFLLDPKMSVVSNLLDLAYVEDDEMIRLYEPLLHRGERYLAKRVLLGDRYADLDELICQPEMRAPDTNLMPFWLNCLGRGRIEDDAVLALVEELGPSVFLEAAPNEFLDAWLRRHEAGKEVDPSLLWVLRGLTLSEVRVDLVTRAKWAMRELEQYDQVAWP